MRSRAASPLLVSALLFQVAVGVPAGSSQLQDREPSPTRGAGTVGGAGAAYFEEDLGQVGTRGGFLWRGSDGPAHITATGASLPGGGGPSFLGANPRARIEGTDRLPGRSSYFRGQDPSGWISGVRHFRRLRAHEVYPGIDVVWRATPAGELEYDLIVAPHADLATIRVAFPGASVTVTEEGELALRTPTGKARQRRPVAFQLRQGQRRPVEAGYDVSRGGVVRLRIGRYDRSRTLIIDPVLEYSTYIGGSYSEFGMAVAAGPDGTAVAAGYTQSPDIRNQSGGFGARWASDVFITKLASDGTLIYAAYLGSGEPTPTAKLRTGCGSPLYFTLLIRGCGDEYAFAVAMDGAGSVVVAGFTTSQTFPVVGAPQPSFAGGTYDVFVSKISSPGTELIYSTYLGGTGDEEAHALAIDPQGRAVVAGATNSADFPRAEPLQGTLAGTKDAFVTRLSPGGRSIQRSTFFGGSGHELIDGVAIRPDGSPVLTGWTTSDDLPMVDAIQSEFAGGEPSDFGRCPCDVFVTGLTPSLDAVAHSTYLGGSSNDYGRDIALGPDGRAYVIGYTLSEDFPTAQPFQSANAGPADGFLVEIAADGRSLEAATYLGGEHPEDAGGVAVDRCENVYAVGYTPSKDFPMLRSMQGPNPGGTKEQNDAYVMKFDPDRRLVYSTLVGGVTFDGAYAVAVDDLGTAYVAGYTGSNNFPTQDAIQTEFGGETDATLFAISDEICDPSQTDSAES